MQDKTVNRFEQRLHLFFSWCDERQYCSEVVWKVYHRALALQMGKLQKLRSSISTPRSFAPNLKSVMVRISR
ncbi:hypothetical protein IV503_12450 [Klebsiella huaxiensis]